MTASKKNYLMEKRWALAAIGLGFLAGFVSAFLCVALHLVIFGFNIMYIVSPLLAGFVETFIARKKYGRSTGAISALLTFLLINIYGWFLPGWYYPKEPVTLSLITLIAIILTIQAAFPILVNYILFVVVMDIFRMVVELPSKLGRKAHEVEGEEIWVPSADETFLDELDSPLLSVPDLEGRKIKRYVGLVGGEAVAPEKKESEGLLSKISGMVQPVNLEDMDLGDAKKLAISRMLDEARSIGANTVTQVSIDYVSMGGLQGSALIVTATGTAVVCE